jgi:hypothetical protein
VEVQPAVVVNTSVGFSAFPLLTATNSGLKTLPVLVRPSYSPRRYPNGPRAAGACSMSNGPVRWLSLLQLAGDEQFEWQWTIQ